MKTTDVTVNGQTFSVEVEKRYSYGVKFKVNGRSYLVEVSPPSPTTPIEPSKKTGQENNPPKTAPSTSRGNRAKNVPRTGADSDLIDFCAPMPGLIVSVKAEVATRVEAGDEIFTLEAMKMQNTVEANCAGEVVELLVQPGEEVAAGQVLLRLKATVKT